MTTPQFRRFADQMIDGLIVTPRLTQYLAEGRFPQRVEASLVNRDRERPADGWFWPSTHPGWSERELYVYLTQPESLISRAWDYNGILSVNVGTMVHELIKAVLRDEGVLVKPEGATCGACGRKRTGPKACNEHGFVDKESRTRGHIDGILYAPECGMGGWDLKTTNSRTISTLVDNDVEFFRNKWPYYYDQAQEYMRISGLPFVIITFLALGYPWTIKEVRLDFDRVRSNEIRDKYMRVIAAAEAGEPPLCCRFDRKSTSECAARGVCAVNP